VGSEFGITCRKVLPEFNVYEEEQIDTDFGVEYNRFKEDK
jgi:hypothetical protein